MTNSNAIGSANGTRVQLLTHFDITALLLAYSTAIELDQRRANALQAKDAHRLYDPDLWKGYRKDSLLAIWELLVSVRDMPPKLLKDLTEVAICREAKTMRNALVFLLYQNATDAICAGQIDSAPLFFRQLMKSVGAARRVDREYQNAKSLMMQWLTPIDPLDIAKDPECLYFQALRRISSEEKSRS